MKFRHLYLYLYVAANKGQSLYASPIHSPKLCMSVCGLNEDTVGVPKNQSLVDSHGSHWRQAGEYSFLCVIVSSKTFTYGFHLTSHLKKKHLFFLINKFSKDCLRNNF